MLNGLIERAATAAPDKVAIVWRAERLSYAALAARIEHCAAGLAALGLGAGVCVGLVLPNRPEFIIAFFAAMRLDAIIAPVSPQATAPELERLLADAGPRLVICDAARLAACREVAVRLPHLPRLIVVGGDGEVGFETLGADGAPAPRLGMPNSRALYLYTSGSTDTFKRVCCTQSNLWFEALNFVESARLTADDTILCAVPLHHSYGLGNGLLDAAFLGATLVLEPDSDIPFAARHARMLDLLSAERVRLFPGVPFQFEVLAASSEDVGAAFRDVRWCVSSGDTLRKQTFDRFLARTGHPIRSLYGSTEAGSIAMDVGPAAGVRFGGLGPPLNNVTIEVRGEAGEIWVKSPTIPPGGYDNRPTLNPLVFQGGFYNTGDLGRLDAGQLVMTGRKQSFFDVGGHKVDLAEVEEILLGHPQVRDAAVVGVAVPRLGGVLKAVVVAEESSREADILDHCRRRLAAFKVPRFIEFRELLPRSPLGKLLRAELLDTAGWLSDVPSARDVPRGSQAQRIDWLSQRIAEQAAAILACEPAAIARNVAFQSLGFDSLRVVELQERLSRMSGVALSITTLWNHPSIAAYAVFLLDAMQGSEPRGPAEDADPLDSLSDQEIAAMLARELDLSAEAT
jgi:long-chain acyl-CoA synthetase